MNDILNKGAYFVPDKLGVHNTLNNTLKNYRLSDNRTIVKLMSKSKEL